MNKTESILVSKPSEKKGIAQSFPFISILALSALCIQVYFPTFRILVNTWMTRDEYSHGFFIPLISLYMVWVGRKKFADLSFNPSLLTGIPLLFMATLMLLAGRFGSFAILEELSFILFISGIVLTVAGIEYYKALFFPIAYTLFMIPFSEELVEPIQWSLRLLTAEMAVRSLQWLGFSAYLENQYIVLPNITLEVAKACSGATLLIPVVALSVPLAYFTLKSWKNRLFLIFSGIIVAILANWFRIVTIGIGAIYGYTGALLHGPYHILHALLITQISFVYLAVAAWFLYRTQGEKTLRGRPPLEKPAFSGIREFLLPRSFRGWIAGILGLSVLLGWIYHVEIKEIPLKAGFETFPLTLGEWKGDHEPVERAPFRIEGTDQENLMVYHNPAGEQYEVYIAYLETQGKGRKLVNEQTWNLHNYASEVSLEEDASQGLVPVRINAGTLPENRETAMFFWYDFNNRVIAGKFEAKAAVMVNGFLHGKSNGSFVMISRKGNPEMGPEDKTFIQTFLQILRIYLG